MWLSGFVEYILRHLRLFQPEMYPVGPITTFSVAGARVQTRPEVREELARTRQFTKTMASSSKSTRTLLKRRSVFLAPVSLLFIEPQIYAAFKKTGWTPKLRVANAYVYLKYWIALKGCPCLIECHSILRPWWTGSEGQLIVFRF